MFLRSVLYNLAGMGVSVVIAIVMAPVLLSRIGPDRFGILNITWVVIGYFALFDFGLGRAITKMIAEAGESSSASDINGIFWTAMLVVVAFSIVGTVILIAASGWLAGSLLKMPAALRNEAARSMYILSASLPFTIMTSGMRGVFEGYRAFGWANALRVLAGIGTYGAPIAVLPYSSTLLAIAIVVFGSRTVIWVIHIVLCVSIVPDIRWDIRWQHHHVAPLLKLGSWMTVTSVVGPFMVAMDRVIIGMAVSTKAVVWYSIPSAVMGQISIVPIAVMTVLFPEFARRHAREGAGEDRLYGVSVAGILMTLLPVAIGGILFAKEGLELWLGSEFARHATVVMQVLTIGMLANSVARVPFTYLQGIGRPDVTAKVHLIEVPPYICGLWLMTTEFGIEGAALAWSARMIIDCMLLFALARRMKRPERALRWQVGAFAVLCCAALAGAAVPWPLGVKLGAWGLSSAVTTAVGWLVLFRPQERHQIWRRAMLSVGLNR